MRWGFRDSSTCELSFVLPDPPWRALLQSSVSDVYVCAGCKHQASHWRRVQEHAAKRTRFIGSSRNDSWSDAKFLFRVEAESAPVPSNKVQIDRCILWSGASYGCFEDQEKHRRGLRTPCTFVRPQNHSQRLTCAQSWSASKGKSVEVDVLYCTACNSCQYALVNVWELGWGHKAPFQLTQGYLLFMLWMISYLFRRAYDFGMGGLRRAVQLRWTHSFIIEYEIGSGHEH